MAIQSTTVDANGFNIHLLEAGEGEPVLFLHGYPTNAQLWRHVLPGVARTHRALAMDLPGFGRSQTTLDRSYDLAFFHDMIDATLDALNIDTIGLCVHDAGGFYGLTWAVKNPHRVQKLCLLNTVARTQASLTARATIWGYRTPGLRRLMATDAAIRMGMQMGMSRTRLDDAAMERYVSPFRRPNAREAFVRAVAAVGDWSDLRSVEEGLSQFADIPVRIIYGTADRILPGVGETLAFVHRQLPHAEVTKLDGVGHFLQEDAPGDVADLIAAFFA